MKVIILFPCDYFEPSKVDMEYQQEYEQACCFPELQIVLYNHDYIVNDGKLKLYPGIPEPGFAICRGWMLKPEQYEIFYSCLMKQGLKLINTPKEYEACHGFKNVYPLFRSDTPKLFYYPDPKQIPWNEVKNTLRRFMIKDEVKSVKGTGFPLYFDTSISELQLNQAVQTFVELRGKLMTGGITIKEYVELACKDGITNEYRVFILNHQILSISRNSNQSADAPVLPRTLAERYQDLPSNFYTVDWAETKDHGWTVIETGDGQVSGLSPGQYVFQFYSNLVEKIKDTWRDRV